MTTDGAILHELQQLDSEADAKRRRLSAVESSIGESDLLRRARQAAERAEALAHKQALRQRDLELELAGFVEKADRSENLLYGGTVKNAKELADLQAEVASMRRYQAKLEDDLLAVMIQREEAEAAAAAARQRLAETEARWMDEQGALQAEREAIRRRLTEIEHARAALIPAVEPADLATYQSLRPQKGGVAVAVIHDDTCSACGVAVTQGRKWQIREGNLVQCSNCERILVILGR